MDSAVLEPPRTSEDARTLAARAAESEGLGHWDAAARHYSLAFRASVLDRDIAAAADALRGQARVRNHQRRFDEAEELAQLSLSIAERNGLHQAAARALNVLGIILHARGDWEQARAYFPRALEMALDLGDDDLAGLACLNAGVIANSQGNPREARTLYLESIGSFVRSGNSVNAMMAYNNLGLASADLREWIDAEVYFSRGIEIGERLQHSPQLAKLYCNRAEPLIHVGELARASASLDQAERMARVVGDRVIQAEAHRFRGTIARLRREFQTAEEQLSQSLEVAGGAGLTLERAEALREMARLREDQERVAEAREIYRLALDLFRSLGADTVVHSIQAHLAQRYGMVA